MFLSTDEPNKIMRLVDKFPEFLALYRHIYEICANTMNWENGIRIIIHIADAPAHSNLYNDGDDGGDYSSQGPRLDGYIKECADKNINIVDRVIHNIRITLRVL